MREPRATPNIIILAPLLAIAVVLVIGLMGALESCPDSAAGCRYLNHANKIEKLQPAFLIGSRPASLPGDAIR